MPCPLIVLVARAVAACHLILCNFFDCLFFLFSFRKQEEDHRRMVEDESSCYAKLRKRWPVWPRKKLRLELMRKELPVKTSCGSRPKMLLLSSVIRTMPWKPSRVLWGSLRWVVLYTNVLHICWDYCHQWSGQCLESLPGCSGALWGEWCSILMYYTYAGIIVISDLDNALKAFQGALGLSEVSGALY